MASISTQDLIPHLQLPNTFGALFIGVILAAVLFGVTNVQAFVYFQTHSGTGITFHKLVLFNLGHMALVGISIIEHVEITPYPELFRILDALHLVLIVHCMYFYLVINYANIGALAEMVWSSKLQWVVAVLSIFLEHLLYVHRIWTVSKGRSKVLPITAGIVVVLTSGPAIAAIWCIYQGVHTIADLVNVEWTLYMYVGTVAFVDILIASLLCYLLATSRTGFSRQNGFIHNKALELYHQYRLFDKHVFNSSYHYSEITSLVLAICLSDRLQCAVMPKNYIFEAIEFFALKLHVNSYIALLNVRYYAQPHADTMHTSEYHMRHDVYHPRLHVRASQDEELQASRKSMFKHPNDEVLHITRPVQAVMPQRPIEVTIEMSSLSSA
ncbi:hypothetical protein EV702DRAFT_1199017 [Suillus placidus]|uniref:DUF6534 domain-containing protein n=1 Tax=Suillus placidus TaxID=48579 RepID=A0A9P7D1K6_9AGAM|nr:hypothetical protein EV702DRAFT_1199017 [Suillus placidus]